MLYDLLITLSGGGTLTSRGHKRKPVGTSSHRFFWLMGDRRAIGVRSALVKAGAGPKQLQVQSQGAARPLIEMAGDEVGRYRRRVSIDYLTLDAATGPPMAREGSPQWWRSVLGAGNRLKLPADRPDPGDH